MNADGQVGAISSQKQTNTNIQAINQALADALADDPMVLVFGEDVADPEEGGVIGATKGLSTKYGDHRVRSTPISEQAIIGAAIGVSMRGYRPVAEIMLMNFTTIAMDMIVNHAAKLRYMSGGQTHIPIVVRTMTGTGFASAGQHSDYLEAWFAHTPGLKVVAPSNPADYYGLLRASIDDPDPVIFVENGPDYWTPGPRFTSGARIALSQAHITLPGTDATIISYSRSVGVALAAAKALQADGISVEVVDLRTISPWDQKTVIESVAKTGRGLVVHEAVRAFGVGAEIAATLQEALFGQLKSPIRRLGAPFCPVPFSAPLEAAYAPGVEAIKSVIEQMIDS